MLFFIVLTAGVIKHFHEGPGRKYLGFIDYDVVMAALLWCHTKKQPKSILNWESLCPNKNHHKNMDFMQLL